MTDLMAIRPIDANELYDKLFYRAIEAQGEDECTEETIKECMRLVRDAPTIDAVPVVRCKDCVSHGNCLTEDTFRIARIENPYCCGGKRRSDG